MNLTDPIWRNMHAWPERPALIAGGNTVTYSGLRATVERLVTRLQTLGIVAGDCVGVSCSAPAPHLSLLLALARMGAVSCPMGSEWPQSMRDQILARNRVRLCIREDFETWPSEVLADDGIATVGRLFADLESVAPWTGDVAQVSGDQVWRIYLSSGTTGTPKSIPWTHRDALMHQMLHMGVESCGPGARALVFCDVRIALALNRCLRQWVAGGALVLATGADTPEFFRVVLRDAPDSVLTTTAIAAQLMASAPSTVPDMSASKLQTITLSGSAAPAQVVAALLERLCPVVRNAYASTELGWMALVQHTRNQPYSQSAGRLMPWVQAQAVDDDGVPLPAGAVGVLRFRAPMSCEPYLDDPVGNGTAFVDGWHYPGDIGSVDERGVLTLQGRTDDRLNLQGAKVDPFAIEKVLLAYAGIADAGVTMARDASEAPRLIAVLVLSGPMDLDLLTQWCRSQLVEYLVPQQFKVVYALPHTPAGKLDREALQRLVGLF